MPKSENPCKLTAFVNKKIEKFKQLVSSVNRPVSFSVKMYKSFALVKSSLKVSSGFDKVGVVKLEIKLPLYAERNAGKDHHSYA